MERLGLARLAHHAERLAGVRCRGQRKRQSFTAQLGTYHLGPVFDEAYTILHTRDDYALDPGKSRSAPVGPMRAAVTACCRQAADVSFGAIVIGWHSRVVQEGEQFVAMLVQPLPNPQTVGMARLGFQHQIVEAIDDQLVGFVERRMAELLSVLAQLNGISKQIDERLNERPHRLPRKLLTELGQLTEQVDQAALLGTIQAVVSRVEIADQCAGKRLAQNSDDDVSAAVAIDEKQGQTRIAEAPGPGGLAVDAPARFISLDHGRLAKQFEEFLDHRREQLAAPMQVTEQPGPADRQPEEVVQQVLSFTQGYAQVSAAVAGQQPGSRTDMRAREFQVPAALAGLLTTATAVDMAAVAMPLDLGFGDISHEVIFELAGRFEIRCTTMGTLLRTDVVFSEFGAWWGLRSKGPRVLAVFLATPVGAGNFGVDAAILWMLLALVNLLEFVLQLLQPTTQFRIFRFQLGHPLLKGAHQSRDGGLGLGWNRIPERCRDRSLRNHPP
jgi:hypothetical protein